MFESIVLGFLGFFNGKVRVNVFENIILEQHFSRVFIDILYVPVARLFVDFVNFICLRILRNLIDLKNGELMSLLNLMF